MPDDPDDHLYQGKTRTGLGGPGNSIHRLRHNEELTTPYTSNIPSAKRTSQCHARRSWESYLEKNYDSQRNK